MIIIPPFRDRPIPALVIMTKRRERMRTKHTERASIEIADSGAREEEQSSTKPQQLPEGSRGPGKYRGPQKVGINFSVTEEGQCQEY